MSDLLQIYLMTIMGAYFTLLLVQEVAAMLVLPDEEDDLDERS